ncbi:hypothetical protein [Dyadobacter arcticus]|uniref:2OG-Fe(II) oxygenase n=1 Tax=Dyadobacter arcticus TaxID=1078754 RepID=A0ABX0UIE9_9BACT|nr:hypothetical protein [Dyadobacter arcticus]NIJ52788.1 hypothetical protein [Dyadobacter arcticus]
MKYLNYQNFSFDYDPFPLGVAQQFVEPEHYKLLVENFPSVETFGNFFDKQSNKKALSELYNADAYHAYVRQTPIYLDFYHYIKSHEFIHDVLNTFEQNYIELKLSDTAILSSTSRLGGSFSQWLENQRNRLLRKKGLRARFEFSALPSDGGNVRPHTDAPQKVITLVLSILREGEWNPAWKGGTDVLKPKDMRRNYNFYNAYFDFHEVDVIKTVEYLPNQCILFLKTFNSLHSVPPLRNLGGTELRRTLTINIDQVN